MRPLFHLEMISLTPTLNKLCSVLVLSGNSPTVLDWLPVTLAGHRRRIERGHTPGIRSQEANYCQQDKNTRVSVADRDI